MEESIQARVWASAPHPRTSVESDQDLITIYLRGHLGTGMIWENVKTPPSKLARDWFAVIDDEVRFAGNGSGRFVELHVQTEESTTLSMVPRPIKGATLTPYRIGVFHPGTQQTVWMPDSAQSIESRPLNSPTTRTEIPTGPRIVIR